MFCRRTYPAAGATMPLIFATITRDVFAGSGVATNGRGDTSGKPPAIAFLLCLGPGLFGRVGPAGFRGRPAGRERSRRRRRCSSLPRKASVARCRPRWVLVRRAAVSAGFRELGMVSPGSESPLGWGARPLSGSPEFGGRFETGGGVHVRQTLPPATNAQPFRLPGSPGDGVVSWETRKRAAKHR